MSKERQEIGVDVERQCTGSNAVDAEMKLTQRSLTECRLGRTPKRITLCGCSDRSIWLLLGKATSAGSRSKGRDKYSYKGCSSEEARSF